MARETHSDKAKATLAAMGILGATFTVPNFRWVEEERLVLREVTCPSCDGGKYVQYDAEGKLIPRPKWINYGQPGHYERERERSAYDREARKNARGSFGNCTTCMNKRTKWGRICTGKVEATVTATVLVGYPIWPEGTVLDSRFQSGGCCQLCNKRVPSRRFVAVHAPDAQGKHHALWVGEDCARKILSVKVPKTPNEDAVVSGPVAG